MKTFIIELLVVIAKVGTLIIGEYVESETVTNIKSFGIDELELLKLTAKAEIISEHQLGHTIVRETENAELQ